MRVYEGRGEANLVFMQKKKGMRNCSVWKVQIALFQACSPGVNPMNRRPKGAKEGRLIPGSQPRTTVCRRLRGGRLGYNASMMPGTGHASGRNTSCLASYPESGSRPSRVSPTSSLEEKHCLMSNSVTYCASVVAPRQGVFIPLAIETISLLPSCVDPRNIPSSESC